MNSAAQGERVVTERALKKSFVWLLACGIAALLLLTGTHAAWRARICANLEAAKQKPLLEALPAALRQHVTIQPAGLIDDVDQLKLHSPTPTYRVLQNGKPIGWLYPAIADDGYGGDIELIVGVRTNGDVLGVTIRKHRETPGIGARITGADRAWLEVFQGRNLENPRPGVWFVKGDGGAFDQITGATVTSRAVTNAIRRVLVYHARKSLPASKEGGGTSHE
jgi:electron transport complex protein RnfG